MAHTSDLVPLMILLIVICVAAVIGFVAYSIATDVAAKTKEKMEKKNISLHRHGLKVGMRTQSSEQVADSTQSVLMKVWNNASWPSYSSRLGWGQSSVSTTGTPASTPGIGTEKRKPFSRSPSSQQGAKRP